MATCSLVVAMANATVGNRVKQSGELQQLFATFAYFIQNKVSV